MTSLPDALTIDDLHRAYADGMTAAEVIEEAFLEILAGAAAHAILVGEGRK